MGKLTDIQNMTADNREDKGTISYGDFLSDLNHDLLRLKQYS